ncbi:hypothetical protein BJ742DRAFT_804370 [Cladochytrium replicatum]|nr:hypothetical protein BJ742DRAFT_804370 [Cladochytrium replicatum]
MAAPFWQTIMAPTTASLIRPDGSSTVACVSCLLAHVHSTCDLELSSPCSSCSQKNKKCLRASSALLRRMQISTQLNRLVGTGYVHRAKITRNLFSQAAKYKWYSRCFRIDLDRIGVQTGPYGLDGSISPATYVNHSQREKLVRHFQEMVMLKGRRKSKLVQYVANPSTLPEERRTPGREPCDGVGKSTPEEAADASTSQPQPIPTTDSTTDNRTGYALSNQIKEHVWQCMMDVSERALYGPPEKIVCNVDFENETIVFRVPRIGRPKAETDFPWHRIELDLSRENRKRKDLIRSRVLARLLLQDDLEPETRRVSEQELRSIEEASNRHFNNPERFRHPPAELLDQLQASASLLFTNNYRDIPLRPKRSVAHNRAVDFWPQDGMLFSMDGTALLAMGVLAEEYAHHCCEGSDSMVVEEDYTKYPTVADLG